MNGPISARSPSGFARQLGGGSRADQGQETPYRTGLGYHIRSGGGRFQRKSIERQIRIFDRQPQRVAQALEAGFSAKEVDQIVASAEEMWTLTLWIAFFNRLRQVMFAEAPAEVGAEAAVMV